MTNLKRDARIQEVRGLGIQGYRVEFSIKDLFKLSNMCYSVKTLNDNVDAQAQAGLILAEVIDELVHATIYTQLGGGADEWDFLQKESAE